MLSDIYSERILAAAASSPPARRLDAPQASARKASRVCGSEVVVDLNLTDGKVSEVGMEAKACALGQATAAILANNIVGATPAEIYRLRDEMRAMLKELGPAPSGERWRDLAAFEALREYPQRHASMMLAFEAACACLDSFAAAI